MPAPARRPGSRALYCAPVPRRPWLTLSVAAVTAATTALGLVNDDVTRALARDRAFGDGEWWRLLSPILVNPEGWHQILFNLVALLVFGTAAERVFGRARWIALYLAGALAGELFSYATGNYSAGTSVAVAGLFGGLLAWVLTGRAGLPAPPRIVAGLLRAGAVLLAVLGDEHGAPLLVGTGLGALLLHGRPAPTARDLAPTARRRAWRPHLGNDLP